MNASIANYTGFQLVTSSDFFTIDHNTGVITTTKPIDYETDPTRINMSLIAYPIDETCKFEVQAEDRDSGQNANLTFTLAGPSAASFSVDRFSGVVTVADSLSLDRENSSVHQLYNLYEGGRGFFTINNSTGQIRTTQALDREQFQAFNVTILAYDRGSPQLIASTTVRVDVQDENDNAPVFEELNYLVNLDEGNSCASSSILTVKASDADAGQNADISYSIDTDLLLIDSTTGEIRCDVSGLDYENVTQRDFIVSVVARDQGSPPLNHTAFIRLIVRQKKKDSSDILCQSDFEFSYPETYCNSSSQIIGNLTLAPRTAALNPSVSLVTSDVPFRLDLNVTGGTIPLLCNGSLDKEENEKYDGIFAKVEANGWRNYASR
nr:hypothetical protein BaRGS_006135 [Batillaria attramentaria]